MYTLNDIQQVDLTISGVDAAGNPAVIKGATWATSDPGILTVKPNTDGTVCTVVTTGKLGRGQVTVTAQGPRGQVKGILEVEVIGSDAVAITVSPGKPADRALPPSGPSGVNPTPAPGPAPAPAPSPFGR